MFLLETNDVLHKNNTAEGVTYNKELLLENFNFCNVEDNFCSSKNQLLFIKRFCNICILY